MFDQLKSMQAVASLLKNKEKLAEAGERVKTRTAEIRATGASGGGACRATVSGRMELLDLHLEPALLAGMAVDDKTRALATGLIRDAVNDAMRGAQSQVKDLIAREAEALGLPGIEKQLNEHLGGVPG